MLITFSSLLGGPGERHKNSIASQMSSDHPREIGKGELGKIGQGHKIHAKLPAPGGVGLYGTKLPIKGLGSEKENNKQMKINKNR